MKNNFKLVLASSIGSMLEMYDFVIYILVASIIAKLFFPADNTYNSMMLTFAAFAAGFIARPAGSIIFGHFGDILGRKTTLIGTIYLMAAASLLIAIMPSYYAIGITAPILIIILRILQGIAVGGEFSGAVTLVAENVDPKKRGFYTSWIFFFINLGIMLASGVISLFTVFMSKTAFFNLGWRLLFILGAIIAIIGIYLRRRIQESKLFTELKANDELAIVPILATIIDYWRKLLIGLFLFMGPAVFVGMVLMYMPSYLISATHITLKDALLLNTIGIIILCCFIPMFGWLSDIWGRKVVISVGLIGLMISSYPAFMLINYNNSFIIIALIVLNLFGAAILGSFGAILSELYTTKLRYTGVGISYNFPFAIFAGTTPMLSLFFMKYLQNINAPGLYLAFSALISFIFVYFVHERKGLPLQ